jgi:CRP-like cAMP-binding protein
MNTLLEYLSHFDTLSAAALHHLQQVTTRNRYPAKYQLLHVGDVCTHVHFVEKGVLRAYYLSDTNEDLTTWLAAEHEVITQPHSLHYQVASTEAIEVLEEATLWSIQINDLRMLQQQYPDVALISLQFQQRYLIRYEERLRAFLRFSADERYEHFSQALPHLLHRVSLKYVASYLGMTPSTLSHVRAGLKERGKGV